MTTENLTFVFSYYQVDGLVEEFAGINRGMEKSGTFTMDKKKLLQLVGKANSNLADVILKVGLFERYYHSCLGIRKTCICKCKNMLKFS